MGFAAGLHQAVRYFLAAGWIWIAFRFSLLLRQEYHSKTKAFVATLGASLLLAFIGWSVMGTHVEDADPVMGGGEVVVDYEPTHARRTETGTLIFFITFVPASVALLKRESPRKS
jgi:hypothetical protein